MIDIATRVVHIAGTTTNPDSPFMAQVARNLSDCVAGFPQGKRLLILDRDGKFTTEFKRILEDAAVRMLLTPYQAPNMNAFAERWIRSIKAECLRKMILFGSSSLERVIRNYVDHYHEERSHQGLGNELIRGDAVSKVGDVKVSQRLGGLLQYYHRHAA